MKNLFTKREAEILPYLAEGLSSKQIAAKLLRSISTVSNHRKNMLKKMKAKNTTELINIWVQKNNEEKNSY